MKTVPKKPILFSAPMVRAIIAGTKTQTRRVVRYPHSWLTPYAGGDKAKAFELFHAEAELGSFWNCGAGDPSARWQCSDELLPQNYQPGTRLWVKETHLPSAGGIYYRADFTPFDAAGHGAMYGGWKPSIFCRREYSRITLEIAAVRVERLQAISQTDALAEGMEAFQHSTGGFTCPAGAYRELWETLHGPGSWGKNPWVWVIAFRRLTDRAENALRELK